MSPSTYTVETPVSQPHVNLGTRRRIKLVSVQRIGELRSQRSIHFTPIIIMELSIPKTPIILLYYYISRILSRVDRVITYELFTIVVVVVVITIVVNYLTNPYFFHK